MAIESLPLAPKPQADPGVVFFDRFELRLLLDLYARMVSSGKWRDYAIDGMRDRAAFSVFQHASEAPLYRVEKAPGLARKQGAWAVIARGGVVLRRGHELSHVLRVFDSRRFSVVE